MKKYTLLFCLFVFITACTNTIGYLPNDEPTKLIVNALMEAGSNDNRIYLHYTGWASTTPVTDGVIHIYINGELKETVTSEGDYYPVKSNFNVGDVVKIEALTDNGTYRAEAETCIYPPLQILQIDTSYVKLRDYDAFINNQPVFDNYLRLKIKLKLPESKPQGSHFRLEVFQVYYIQNKYYDESQIDTLSIDTTLNYNYIYDTALTDGRPGQAMDEGFELIQKWENYFGIFKNSYFQNGEYTMTVDLKEDINHFYYETNKTERYITVRLYSISESEFNYLHTMASVIDFDSDNFIYPVPLIPSNVTGGIGILGIENKTEYALKEENCQEKFYH